MTNAVKWHDQTAQSFDERYRTSRRFRERLSVWKHAIESYVISGSVVFDLGCGSGILSVCAAHQGAQVLAVDGSQAMIELAREKVPANLRESIRFLLSELEPFPNVEQQADVIICSSVYEYLRSPQTFLAACSERLNPGGRLLLTIPNMSSWYRRAERMSHQLIGRPSYLKYVATAESTNETVHRFEQAGLEVCGISYLSGPPGVTWLSRATLGQRYSDTLALLDSRIRAAH